MFHVKQSEFSLENVLLECGWNEPQERSIIKERLELYLGLICKWNQAVNLVGNSTLEGGWERHILDSAQLLPLILSAGKQPTVLDIGSGAGLPGLALAILGGCEVTLVEANARKCRFLEEVSSQTQAAVDIICARVEEVNPWMSDFVVSRAVAPLSQLLEYSAPFCGPESQCLFLKGKDTENEIKQARALWNFGVDIFPSKTSCQGTVIRVQHIRKL